MRHGLRVLGILLSLALSACGGGGGDSSGGPNTAPTANFTYTCTDLKCYFTSTSTDQDVGDTVASYAWTFGDGSSASLSAPIHDYAAASTYSVVLTVTDRAGATGTRTQSVTPTAAAAPAAPHAAFTYTCVSLDCTFTNFSTHDVVGTPLSWSWDFGDGTPPVTTLSPTHRYAVSANLTNYTVKLTATDPASKTSTTSQTVVVAPPVITTLTLTQASRVTATLVSRSCAASQNRVDIVAPFTQNVFVDGCTATPNVPVSLNGGALIAAGPLQVAVYSGTLATSKLAFTPTVRLTGDFASGWTLTFDDGYGGPAEPDFNDLVILIRATP